MGYFNAGVGFRGLSVSVRDSTLPVPSLEPKPSYSKPEKFTSTSEFLVAYLHLTWKILKTGEISELNELFSLCSYSSENQEVN